jgi:hypothetical protein
MTCSFCDGRAVLNAGAWLADNEHAVAPCPRCGERRCTACSGTLTDTDAGVCTSCARRAAMVE